MKYFSLKILILCIILPPVFYVLTIQFMENQFQMRYLSEIKDIYIGDTKPLFDGRISLKESIKKNIDQYLLKQILPHWGANLEVVVTTKYGIILYPSFFEEKDNSMLTHDSMRLATENYNYLNEGMKLNVDLEIRYNTLISNIILIFYILLSILIFYHYYTKGIKKIKDKELRKNYEIGNLIQVQEKYTSRIERISGERQKLSKELKCIKKELDKEKIKADRTENDMIEEIMTLEKTIKKSLKQQNKQKDEIELLRKNIDQFEHNKHKSKATKITIKRFNTLYKNIKINNKAIDGFIRLPDDIKIKSEEIIHQLNEDASVVSIKRKVFAKKNTQTAFEVIFAYSGRLYFSKTKDNKIEVLTIGTKNTQNKDLQFLNNL
ncbi:MAG: hypothetical protein J7K84_11275 [Deltaproteobacteria bacterium]|nr:hypothetical protein [Deltaproteobacteria bacterium]